MASKPCLALVAALFFLVPLELRAENVDIRGVCPDFKLKGQKGDLLILCPLPPPRQNETRVQLRIVKPCAGQTVRAYYSPTRNYLTCGSVDNPLVHRPPPAAQVIDLK